MTLFLLCTIGYQLDGFTFLVACLSLSLSRSGTARVTHPNVIGLHFDSECHVASLGGWHHPGWHRGESVNTLDWCEAFVVSVMATGQGWKWKWVWTGMDLLSSPLPKIMMTLLVIIKHAFYLCWPDAGTVLLRLVAPGMIWSRPRKCRCAIPSHFQPWW